MKPLLVCLTLFAPFTALAQTIIGPSAFFDPDFKVRRDGVTSGTLAVTVTNAPVSQSMTSGNNQWTHAAGGHAQTRSQLTALGAPVANLDAQLAAYTRTTGDTLVFGREITTDVELLGVIDPSAALQGLVNDVAGASVIYDWESSATISGLAIAPDQLYRVDFTVTSGNGLPVNVLDSATFGITTSGVTGASNESAQSLNVLNLLSIGNNSSTGNFSFVFKSDQNLSSLDFNFAASTAVGVSLLGGTAANQNVLTFSGFQVTSVPEPDAAALIGVFATCLIIRRRRAT